MKIKNCSSISFLFFLFVLSAIFCSRPCYAASFTFAEAWQILLAKSDSFAAQNDAIKRQEYLQEAATKHHLPNITLGGNYVRLSEPLTADGSKVEPLASMNPVTVGTALAKMTHVGKISPQFAHDIGNLLQSLSGDSVNTTTELTKQDVFTSTLTAIIPIFTGWRIEAAEEIAAQQTKESKARLALLQQTEFAALAKVYFGVVLAEKVLETKIEAEKGLEIHHNHAIALEKEGQIARVERLKAEAAFDRARVATGKSRRMLEVAKLALTKMLQQESEAVPRSTLFINKELSEKENFIDKTLAAHPALAILKTKKEQAKGLIKVEKGNYYPQLFAMGTYNLYKDNSIVGESTPDWFAGVGMSVSLFDNKGHRQKVEAARAALSQAGHLYKKSERDISVLVEKTWQESMQAMEEFSGLQSSVKLAEENVRLREKGFSQGIFISLDVVDARLFLESVKTQQLVASYNYVVSLAQLLAVSGEIERFIEYQKRGAAEAQ